MRPPRGRRELDLRRELGRRVRSAREAAGLTQEEAAGRARIDYKYWQRLEYGMTNPAVGTLLRAADAVGRTFWDMLGLAPPALRRTAEETPAYRARPRRQRARR